MRIFCSFSFFFGYEKETRWRGLLKKKKPYNDIGNIREPLDTMLCVYYDGLCCGANVGRYNMKRA